MKKRLKNKLKIRIKSLEDFIEWSKQVEKEDWWISGRRTQMVNEVSFLRDCLFTLNEEKDVLEKK